jgi:hypothetical protein
MKIKFIGLLIVFAFLSNCVSSHQEEIQIYVSGLEPMKEKGTDEVLTQIEDNWEFQCNKFWKTKDPTLEDVFKEIKGKTGFEEQEASQIFSPKGEYKVMVFSKSLSRDVISTDTISSMGTSLPHTTYGGKITDSRSAYIRVVFRNNKLVHFKVWQD